MADHGGILMLSCVGRCPEVGALVRMGIRLSLVQSLIVDVVMLNTVLSVLLNFME